MVSTTTRDQKWVGGSAAFYLGAWSFSRGLISMQVPAVELPERLLQKNFRALGLISIKIVYIALDS